LPLRPATSPLAARRLSIQTRRCATGSLKYWDKLSKGGDPKAQQCGWLKDKYGLAWQVVPTVLPEMRKDHESPTAQRAMEAMLRMKKIDIRELERAVAGDRVTA
jgi:predicted 3-demethylubiquinone-9 3-methyltransferase (glyoxalase superfamily)